MTMREDITDIKVSAARIEEHVKATNGKIQLHIKLIYGAYGFAFGILVILIQHIATK